MARNTDGSIQLKLDQVRLKTFASKLKMVIKKSSQSGRFKRTRKARATTCQSFWTDRHQKGWFDIIINCSSCVDNITSIAEPQNHFKCMVYKNLNAMHAKVEVLLNTRMMQREVSGTLLTSRTGIRSMLHSL